MIIKDLLLLLIIVTLSTLMKFPKIGKKTAQQMVLDLAGKFAELPAETTKATPNQPAGNHQLDEAMEPCACSWLQSHRA